jgi:hypothetical protein
MGVSFRELQEAGAKIKTLSLFMNYQLVLTNSLMINQGKRGEGVLQQYFYFYYYYFCSL